MPSESSSGGLVKRLDDVHDVPDLFSRVPADRPRRVADALFDLRLVSGQREAEEGDLAAVGMDEVQDGLDRRRFPGAVAPDESGDFSRLEGKGKGFQLKRRIVLAEIPDRQGSVCFICHFSFPPRHS